MKVDESDGWSSVRGSTLGENEEAGLFRGT